MTPSSVLDRWLVRIAMRRCAIEFPNDAALQRYLKDHPKANRAKHRVKPPQESIAHPDQMRLPGVKVDKPAKKERARKRKKEDDKPKKERAPKDPAKKKSRAAERKPHERYAKQYAILSGEDSTMVSTAELEEGLNKAEFVEVTDPDGNRCEGIWKTRDKEIRSGEEIEEEHGEPLRPNIEAGTYYKREAATSHFDELLGPPPTVPVTVQREFEGEEGSVQLLVPDVWKTDDMRSELVRGSATLTQRLRKLAGTVEAKKLTLMDMISGNDDRHGGNTLWSERVDESGELEYDEEGDGNFTPHAIDNGLAFPVGTPIRFLFAVSDLRFAREAIRPSQETRQMLKKLNLKQFHETMVTNGIEPEARARALARAAAFKHNPDLMVEMDEYDYSDTIEGLENKVHEFLCLTPEDLVERGSISTKDLSKIRDLVGDY